MNASNQEVGQDPKRIPTIQEMESWDDEQLLEWIKNIQPKIFRDNNDVLTFKAARISGSTFLDYAGDTDFFSKTQLPLGVYGALASLAKKVKKQNDQSNQTAGQKRKGDNKKRRKDDETVTQESPTSKSPKRMRLERGQNQHHDNNDGDNDQRQNINLLPEEIKDIRNRRQAIKKIITGLDTKYSHENSASPDSEFALPGAVALLSDPQHEHRLLFPMTILKTPTRFAITKEGVWQYVGREIFPELLRQLKTAREASPYSNLWVYGTRGYGKSHLLAALVCYLSALENRVIYIPDCRICLEDPLLYFQAALLFAFTDKAAQDEIVTLDTKEKIRIFLGRQRNVIFVIDQMNALCEKEGEPQHTRSAKGDLSDWINRLIARHTAVLSSSANNQDYLRGQILENSNFTMLVYGGLTETEMKCWWDRHSDLSLEDKAKENFEDLTGRIPLLLNECVVRGKINLSPLQKVADKAVIFTDGVKLKTLNEGNDVRWTRYCEFVNACFLGLRVQTVIFQTPDLVDYRFFFGREERHEDELDDGSEDEVNGRRTYVTGGCSCGVVREAVANALVQYQQCQVSGCNVDIL
ncbi:uncharacterized protein Z518_03610 [Rhinocladiella mackenziei CBS 650.93]|uniref:NACHT domain-containing protein n=1 Tax=Rhinocladiella mackenziei CBS 650.93 TaxID=1442369 RepID=A0A0D2H5E9_9EURO|nr:uncharacterized protein Z518_03610 [Rhinocladiella mackenziei CBS 650.93]KIX05638.1 hypothetical protein Z518_03610 [Rhinocladiella mackenziei CBS 650.93]